MRNQALIKMKIDIITLQHLEELKKQIVEEIKTVISYRPDEKEWLKSKEVKKALGCSEGTLNNLRASGALPFSKIAGTIYIRKVDLQRLFEENLIG